MTPNHAMDQHARRLLLAALLPLPIAALALVLLPGLWGPAATAAALGAGALVARSSSTDRSLHAVFTVTGFGLVTVALALALSEVIR